MIIIILYYNASVFNRFKLCKLAQKNKTKNTSSSTSASGSYSFLNSPEEEKEKDEEINFELTRSRKSLRKDSRLSSTDKKQEINPLFDFIGAR